MARLNYVTRQAMYVQPNTEARSRQARTQNFSLGVGGRGGEAGTEGDWPWGYT
jgi:hypothetical protein